MPADDLSKGERTQSKILAAAHQQFLLNGYHGASMRQIAQNAGIAPGSIYNHFASKEDIFLAVLFAHHPINDILPAMRAAQADSIETFVRGAAQRMVQSIDNRPDFLNLLFIELVEFNGRHLNTLFGRIFPQVVEAAQPFVQNNSQLRDLPLPILVRAFIGLFFSYVMTQIMLKDQLSDGDRYKDFDHFVDIYLHGILKPASNQA